MAESYIVRTQQITLLIVLVIGCVLLRWRSSSTKENDVHSERGGEERMEIESEALPNGQDSTRWHVQLGLEESPNRKEMPFSLVVRQEGLLSDLHNFAADAFLKGHNPSMEDAAQYASALNDVMDEMLNRSEIPADYAETMVALSRDKSQGDVIRDFAVQHIGLYAETLKMRGKYDADSAESAALRAALWDAAEETRTIVAVAAFRALADMAAFDPRVDAKRLDSRLAFCVADSSASPAARVMAAQLCGERRVTSARASLATIAADRAQPEPLRLAAANSARSLAE